MDALDYKKLCKDLYSPSATVCSVVDVPTLGFLTVCGEGDPNTCEAFSLAIEALYGFSYSIKMSPKKGPAPEGYIEYSVAPLEGLWTCKQGADFRVDGSKDKFVWKLMIMQPSFVNGPLMESFREALQKKKRDNPLIQEVKFETYTEGKSVQMMHIGPYDDEPATVVKMEAFAEGQGLRLGGPHHEIYLGDPRRSAPEKLKTIIRYPVIV